MKPRWLLLAALSLALALASASALANSSTASQQGRTPRAHMASAPKYAWINGQLYAEWECTLSGTVVGAAITFAAPGGIELRALFALFGGGSFTAGCEAGYPHNPTYLNGVPRQTDPSKVCAMIYPNGRKRRRFERCVYFA